MRSRRAATSISYQKQGPQRRELTPEKNLIKKRKGEEEGNGNRFQRHPVVAVDRRAMGREGRVARKRDEKKGDKFSMA